LGVFLVLKEIFKDNIFIDRKDKLKEITFTYYFDSNYKKIYYINIFDFITFILFILLYSIILIITLFYLNIIDFNLFKDTYDLYEISPKIEETYKFSNIKFDTKCVNHSIFGLFVDLFKTNYSIKYFPSYFISSIRYENVNYSILELIHRQHFTIINNQELIFNATLNIMKEYSSTIK
jgi:hypothetical protein